MACSSVVHESDWSKNLDIPHTPSAKHWFLPLHHSTPIRRAESAPSLDDSTPSSPTLSDSNFTLSSCSSDSSPQQKSLDSRSAASPESPSPSLSDAGAHEKANIDPNKVSSPSDASDGAVEKRVPIRRIPVRHRSVKLSIFSEFELIYSIGYEALPGENLAPNPDAHKKKGEGENSTSAGRHRIRVRHRPVTLSLLSEFTLIYNIGYAKLVAEWTVDDSKKPQKPEQGFVEDNAVTSGADDSAASDSLTSGPEVARSNASNLGSVHGNSGDASTAASEVPAASQEVPRCANRKLQYEILAGNKGRFGRRSTDSDSEEESLACEEESLAALTDYDTTDSAPSLATERAELTSSEFADLRSGTTLKALPTISKRRQYPPLLDEDDLHERLRFDDDREYSLPPVPENLSEPAADPKFELEPTARAPESGEHARSGLVQLKTSVGAALRDAGRRCGRLFRKIIPKFGGGKKKSRAADSIKTASHDM